MNILNTLKTRWQAETPILYKAIRNLAATAAGIGTSILAISSTTNYNVAPSITTMASYALLFGTVVATYSQLQQTKKD